MLLKTLVVCLFITACFAGEPSSSSSPSGEGEQCFVDPCSLPAPEGCVFRYCRTKQSGCTAVYLDAAGQEVCEDDTTDCDSAAQCTLYCPYGYKKDSDGCPECKCVDRPDCSTTTCPQVTCSDTERATVIPGECCPVCVPSCSSVECPKVECREGEEKVKGPYDCCAVCRPVDSCSSDDCPDVECRDGEQTVFNGCCKVCVPKVDCSSVMCPEILCLNGSKPRIEDDHCCPVCHEERECEDDVVCPAIACGEGQVEVRVEDECCPICRDADYCDTVVCPVFEGECPDDDDYRVQKEGACCPYCAGTICKDSIETRCDGFDRPVCAPGFFRGENCSEVVPEKDRFELTIEITVKGITLTPEDIKFFIANKLGLDPMYVTVDLIGDNTFVITVSWDRTNPPKGVDEAEMESKVEEVIASNSNFTAKKSSASTLVAGSILAVVALAF